MAVDRYDWHFDSAMEGYCAETGKSKDSLTDEDYSVIQNRAAAHIGFFTAWLIKHDLTGDDFSPEELEPVKKEEITGTEFFMNQCDGKLWDSDVSEDILPFIEDLYKEYLHEYSDFVEQRLSKETYMFDGTWEDYHAVEELIDRLYEG